MHLLSLLEVLYLIVFVMLNELSRAKVHFNLSSTNISWEFLWNTLNCYFLVPDAWQCLSECTHSSNWNVFIIVYRIFHFYHQSCPSFKSFTTCDPCWYFDVPYSIITNQTKSRETMTWHEFLLKPRPRNEWCTVALHEDKVVMVRENS